MIQTATLENVIDQVHQISANHYDEIVPVQEMEFDSLKRMWVAGKQVEVAPSAQRLLSNRLRVPFSYLSRCPANLQAENLNYWIEQERQHRDTFFCRFDGPRLRAVFTDRYRPLDNMEVLSQLIQHGFDPGTKVQYAIDDGMFLVKIPEFARAFDVNPGYGKLDEIVPGVAFAIAKLVCWLSASRRSFTGWSAPTVLSPRHHQRYRGSSTSATVAWNSFPETLAGVIEDSIRKQEQFKLSRRSSVDDPIRSIESFSQRFGLSQTETEVVRQSYHHGARSHDVSHHQCFHAGGTGIRSGHPSSLSAGIGGRANPVHDQALTQRIIQPSESPVGYNPAGLSCFWRTP